MSTTTKHPAKFSTSVIELLQVLVDVEAARNGRAPRVLDPFAGVGRIHDLKHCRTVGVEIEPEWAFCREGTRVGDATRLTFKRNSFDVVMTSPCYGNRMADHHNAKDGSRRMTYRHVLGRELAAGSSASMQWGDAYRELHGRAIDEMVRVTRPGGLIVVNMSNHVRKGEVQRVTEWWVEALLARGLRIERVHPIPTPRMRFGENHASRVQHETIIVMRVPS